MGTTSSAGLSLFEVTVYIVSGGTFIVISLSDAEGLQKTESVKLSVDVAAQLQQVPSVLVVPAMDKTNQWTRRSVDRFTGSLRLQRGRRNMMANSLFFSVFIFPFDSVEVTS
jgi:hypothetical protein